MDIDKLPIPWTHDQVDHPADPWLVHIRSYLSPFHYQQNRNYVNRKAKQFRKRIGYVQRRWKGKRYLQDLRDRRDNLIPAIRQLQNRWRRYKRRTTRRPRRVKKPLVINLM